jgi:hypothetical protein
MNTLGYVGSAIVAFGSVAWTLTTVAGRFDHASDTDLNPPAPANDHWAHPEARSRRAFRIGSAMNMLLRTGSPALPVRMRQLPQALPMAPDVTELDLASCHYYKRCAFCGEPLGQYKAFVLRPISAITRTCVTAPAHQDCAKFRAVDMSAQPGADVVMVWVTRSYELVPNDDVVQIRIGEAEQVFWYLHGRCATRDEVRSSFENALPPLYADAHAESEAAMLELDTKVARVTRLFPRLAIALAELRN